MNEPANAAQGPLTAELRVVVDLEPLVELVARGVVARLGTLKEGTPWLDVEGAAAHLGCSPERVRKLMSRGAIPFHQEQPRSRVFFHRRELDEWLLGL